MEIEVWDKDELLDGYRDFLNGSDNSLDCMDFFEDYLPGDSGIWPDDGSNDCIDDFGDF